MTSHTSRGQYVLACVGTLAACLWLAYQLRFDFRLPEETQRTLLPIALWVVGFKMLTLWNFGQFAVLLTYFSVPDFSRLVWALFTASLILFGISSQMGSDWAPPRGVVLADFSFSVLALTALRLTYRGLRHAKAAPGAVARRRTRRAGIIGAGLVGSTLAQEFANRRALGLQAVAFFDDDRTKWGKRIQNIPVVGAPELLLNQETGLELEEIIIAMPSAPATRVAEIVRTLQRLQIPFSTVPSFYELTTGQAKVSQLRSVEIQDLLGRDPVHLASEAVETILREKVVLVTGAGGSIGSELCRQIAACAPKRLLLVEQSEPQLFLIEQELANAGHGGVIVPLIADILDPARMTHVFSTYRPQLVFHAAAHKHVPMMESQPGEAIKNNSLATLQLAELAHAAHVERFVLISSDKAINPTNVMGATKRLAEMCLLAFGAAHPETTRFMAVRFGNVLGSSGSVVGIFKGQIAAGGPVKVTHPEVTRYFMTVSEAVGLVLQSAALGAGCEIFTLDMGKPVRIVDLARQLIELSGLVPERDIRIEFIGLRPGEKLFEELSYRGESIEPTGHPKIFRHVGSPPPLASMRYWLQELLRQADCRDADSLKSLLQLAVPEYRPQLSQPIKALAPSTLAPSVIVESAT